MTTISKPSLIYRLLDLPKDEGRESELQKIFTKCVKIITIERNVMYSLFGVL